MDDTDLARLARLNRDLMVRAVQLIGAAFLAGSGASFLVLVTFGLSAGGPFPWSTVGVGVALGTIGACLVLTAESLPRLSQWKPLPQDDASRPG